MNSRFKFGFAITALMTAFTMQASAAKKARIDSVYSIFSDGDTQACRLQDPNNLDPGTIYVCDPSGLEGTGYQVELVTADEGGVNLLLYKGKEIPYEKMFKGFEVAEQNYESSTIEWRYQVINGKRVFFAMIDRRTIVHLDKLTQAGAIGTTDELLITKLDGANSHVVAKASTNQEARDIADKLAPIPPSARR